MTVEQGKRVMILGATRHMINNVNAFKQAGLYTIVVDDMAGASAKEHAERSFSCSPEDVLSLAELVKSEGVTGIFADLADITTWNAIALCKKMDLPFYVPADSVSTCNSAFLEHCATFGIQVEEQASYRMKLNTVPLELLGWPPTDKAQVSLVG